ncbi:MAG: efflux RND transporter permease subunit [Deltaproteobacteria bacterium]|nr:efflux RND transporter permease subunit [Deltaproteobacteria bacterium]
MGLVELALRRRVTVAMITVALVLFGLVAFTRLRVGLLPEVSYPSITIETKLAGAAPGEIEDLLSRPIEERVGVVAGVRRVRSTSSAGLSQVTLELAWDRDMDFAAIDVREKLERLRLPTGTEPPTLLRFDPAAEPIMRLFVHGGELYGLRRLAEDVVEKDLESTEGVAAIEVRGGYEPEVEIELDEGRLALVGLGIDEVINQLAKANVDQAGGSLYEREARYLVRARNRLADVEEVRATVLVERDRHRVTVGDVADVRRTHRERETITRIGTAEGIELAIYKEGDANTPQVAQALHQRLEQVRARLPEGTTLTIAADQSTFIRAAVDEVLGSAVWGGALAVLVLLVFLRDLRSTLVIATAIPISAVGTFFLMYETGTTLNVMSLGGLALGVGMLVDNAIVVLEAIHRHRERGTPAIEAARVGAGEVGGAVIASTLTTVAVFVPVVFLDGIAAQLFRDMAVTVCFSLLVSLGVSLTLIPMMVALEGAPSEPIGRVARVIAAPLWLLRRVLALVVGAVSWLLRPIAHASDRVLRGVDDGYPRLLRSALRRPATVLGAATLAFVAALGGLDRLGVDLVPPLSQGELSFVVEMPAGTPLAVTDRTLQAAAADLVEDPRIEQLATIAGRGANGTGGTGAQGEHVGAIQIRMAAGSDAADEAAIAEAVRARLQTLGVARHRAVRPAVFSLHRPVEVEITGDDLTALSDAAAAVQRVLLGIDGLVEVRSSAESGVPEVQVRFDRERILARGLTVEGVAATVRRKLQGEVSTKLRERDRDIDVRVRALSREHAELADLPALIVGSVGAAPVRLSEVAEVTLARGPTSIERVAQSRAAIVDAELDGRDMGAVAREIEAELAELPPIPGVRVRLAGQDEEIGRAIQALLLALALAAFLVYVVMASQFESLLQPLIVMFTLPLGAVGVVAALWATGSSISVISLIGCVMLAGIVVNNAIVLVDAINRRRVGSTTHAAVIAAGHERLRPILMTSITTILGLAPMALGLGAGAELRRALAIAVIGGLTIATALTLVVIPTIYLLVYRGRSDDRDRGGGAP